MSFDEFFNEFDKEIEKIFKKFSKLSSSGSTSGYSISVTYGPDGRPIVNVETYGNIDEDALRREIERMYPGAEIRGLKGSKGLIWEEEEETSRRPKEERKRGKVRKIEIEEVGEERKKPKIIWEDEEKE